MTQTSTDRSERRQRLLRESLRAEQRAVADRAAAGERGDDPRPGDVYLFRETARWNLEWAIIAGEGQRPERLLVMPVDTLPACGSADLGLSAEESGSPLFLRCRFGVQVPASSFDPELRTRVLPATIIEQARQRWRALDEGDWQGGAGGREVDGEPEYREWTEDVLEPARDGLRRLGGGVRELPAPAAPVVRPPAWRWLAAAALLLVTLGLAAYLGEQRQRILRLEAAGQQAEATFRDRLAELERTIAELEVPRPHLNLPVLRLLPGDTVRGGTSGRVVDSEYVFVIVQLEDPLAYPRYRMELTDRAGVVVFSTDEAQPAGAFELTAALPSRWLASAGNRLAVYGLDGRETLLLASYLLDP